MSRQNLLRFICQRYTDSARAFLDCLQWNILQTITAHILRREGYEVWMSASYHALKNKHITVLHEVRAVWQVTIIDFVTLFDGQIERCSIEHLRHFVAYKWIIVAYSLLSYPVADGTEKGHIWVDGIQWSRIFDCSFIEISIQLRVLISDVVFIKHEGFKLTKIIGIHKVDVHRVCLALLDLLHVLLKSCNLNHQTSGVALLMMVELLWFEIRVSPLDKSGVYKCAITQLVGIGMVVGEDNLLEPVTICPDKVLLRYEILQFIDLNVESGTDSIVNQSDTHFVALSLAIPVVRIDG